MASPIAKQYLLPQEQLYLMAIDAANSSGFTIKNKDDSNCCLTVKTGINMYSWGGTIGNVLVKEISEDKSEIIFGGATAASTTTNLMLGQFVALGGAKPIAAKMLKYIDDKIQKGEVPEQKTKKCEFCAEKVKKDAKICKHCGHKLSEA